tara:strand:+ start:7464 stop:8063 length:600 start_codon:yes stop_codon:yes gene_type:complete
MSIGNLKTDGGKGTNWPWQYRMLKGLEGIINAINTTTEAQEYEAKVVNISCPGPDPDPDPHTGDKIYLEVRVFNTDTGAFEAPVYYLPGDSTAYPLSDFTNCTISYISGGAQRTPTVERTTGTGTNTTAIKAISIANVGAVDADIVTSGSDWTIKPGEVVNINAPEQDFFPTNSFYWNTNTGVLPVQSTSAELLITIIE